LGGPQADHHSKALIEPIEDFISELVDVDEETEDEVDVTEYGVSETISHNDIPERISELLPSVIQTSTGLGTISPHTTTGIIVTHFSVCIAVLGTTRTLVFFSIIIFTVTDIPSYIFLSHLFIAILA
jgi:hypothetical protein